MQVTSLLRFSAVCPFLGHSTPASLRALATVSGSNASALTSTALQCPMMGPKLAQIGQQRGYASVAGSREVEEIHKVSFHHRRSLLRQKYHADVFSPRMSLTTLQPLRQASVHTPRLLSRLLRSHSRRPRRLRWLKLKGPLLDPRPQVPLTMEPSTKMSSRRSTRTSE